MHEACFGNSAPQVVPEAYGWWWLAWLDKEPVAFAGLTESVSEPGAGYLYRSGVMRTHRGKKLQRRLIRAREAKARKLGMDALLTDTTFNTASSNSLIKAGYKLYTPVKPWGFNNTLYWRKEMK